MPLSSPLPWWGDHSSPTPLFYTSISPYWEINSAHHLSSSIYTIILIFFSLFLLLLLIFHFVIKPLLHSAYLSCPPLWKLHTLPLLLLPLPLRPQLASDAILQFNCNDNLHYLQELSSILHSKKILIACIQESKLKSMKILPTNSFPNYTTAR